MRFGLGLCRYLTLCIGLAASSVGAYVHMLTHMGGMLSSLAALGLTLWLAFDAVSGRRHVASFTTPPCALAPFALTA